MLTRRYVIAGIADSPAELIAISCHPSELPGEQRRSDLTTRTDTAAVNAKTGRLHA